MDESLDMGDLIKQSAISDEQDGEASSHRAKRCKIEDREEKPSHRRTRSH